MLNTPIHKKLAANAVILLVFLLAVATIRPMRLYREDHVRSTSLEPERISDEVTQELDAGEYFTAEYDHLQTLEFYVHSVTAGTQVRFQLFRVGDNMAMELVAQEDVALPDEVPGYAVVSVDAQMEVGATYVYTVRGLDETTRFTVGYESAEQAAASGSAPAYQLAFYNDTGISGLALKTRLTYRTALGTLPSLCLGVLYLVLAVLAVKVTGLIFRKKPEWNTSLTILQAMQAVLTPVILVLGALAFIAVWPLKLFDSRPLDIIVYETGIVIAVLIALYALRHERTGIPSMVNAHLFRVNVWHYGIILSVAGMLHFSADYMNATSDLGHSAAMNWIIFFLSIILILMGDASSNCSPPVFLALITAPIGSLIYYLVNRVPAAEADAELRNEVLASGCCAFAAAALAVAAVAVMLVKRAQSRPAAGRAGAEETPARGEGGEGSDVAEENPNARQARLLRRRHPVSAGRAAEGPASAGEEGSGDTVLSAGLYSTDGTDFPHGSSGEDLPEGSLHRKPEGTDPSAAARRGGAASGMTDAEWGRAGRAEAVKAGVLPLCVLAALLLLFHHTRSWVFLLVFFWGMFYLRFQSWRGRNRFLQDLCEGSLLDFGFKVVYSLLHRYYPAYIYSRFPMHFHTPTVTAYYLIIVAAAALTLFTRRWRQTQGQTLRQRLPRIWKEALALGVAGSYLMMTLTRSGIGTFAVLLVAAAFCAVPGKGVAAAARNAETGADPDKTTTARSTAAGAAPDSAAARAPRDETGAEAGRAVPGGGASRFGSGCRTLLAMLAAVLIAFPAVFTGQRIISTVYAHPDIFEEVEEYDDWLLRNTEWNNTRFMNVEIFIRDFGDRILGGEVGSDLYYGLGWNIPQGYRTSGLYEEEEESGILEAAGESPGADTPAWTASGQLASASESAAAGLLLSETEQVAAEPDTLEEGDVSNGRLSVYKAYLRGLNLTGHDVMGAELDSGELAVHAHNTVLQVAWDCGIPTGIVFGIVLVILLVLAFRSALRGGSFEKAPAGPGEKTEAPAAAGPEERDPYALLPLLLVLGYGIIGMVEWIFHFSNPFTIALLFGIAPVLFREKRKE